MPALIARSLPALALTVLLLAATSFAAFADITGGYFVYGRNTDGTAYTGTAQILRESDGNYRVEWQTGSSISGVGVLNGDVLTVEWGGDHPAFYIVMPDGDLHGTWDDGLALELLSRAPL